ncbi:hypothetical protein DP939_09470 [Spongiactinospora rosea]|uniref:Uncharacterized protein n=1 Tax=Spongiactinospora rosea TaxID=2248750 RepID=A0A366M1F6_9ACTN|nr:hypothetical protein [Spongiactinospora rosea]RBQ20048.1 hypothetical protein DP939_09470 [Spongiactinospora rosea]
MAEISRRAAIQALSAAALVASQAKAAEAATTADAAAPISIQADGITLIAEEGGSILVRDDADRIRLSHFMIKDTVLGQQRTFGGTPSLVTVDGRPAIQIDYTMSASARQVKVRGLFTVSARRARLRWEVSGSATLTPSGFMFARTVLAPSAPERYVPVTRWTRDTRGGVPYEVNAGALYQETWPGTGAYFRLDKTTPGFTNATWIHAPATTGNVTEADLVLGAMRPQAANGIATGSPLSVDAWCDQAFGVHEPNARMRLRAQVVNGSPTARRVRLTWTVRDFDGRTAGRGALSRRLAPGAVWDETFTVAGSPQGILFAEVKAASGEDEAFARTNLATLKPYEYQAEGRFGVANYFWMLQPDKASVGELMRKIGVKSVRIAYDGAPGHSPAELDALGIAHNVQLGGVVFDGTPEQVAAWADDRAAVARASGARYFEVANELNNPWMQGKRVPEYIRDGLRPIHDRLKDSGIKLMNCGLGGMDTVWTAKFIEAGGWDLIDAFAFHPGRGNFTPDYAPPPEEWEQGENGTYWNFLGSLREARRTIDAQGGGKELWLTEAYACTRPNRWWNDDHRQAAENVLLTLALALSEGVDGVNWYQPHDSTIHHPQEADPANPEYHFGLLNRDTSAKAALLAYATATRTLEGARFLRWSAFPDPDLKGLVFDGFSILWSRKDGYLLNADHGSDQWYPHKEAWADHWPTKTPLLLPATGATVREVDCIGRERILPVRNGRVRVVLDGAPRIYYGLSE